jgi:TolA-binding protein
MKSASMRFFLAALLACLAVGPLLGPITPAHAQMDSREAIALQNQLLELRRDLQALRDQTARAGGGGGGSLLGGARGVPPSGGGGGEMTAQLLDRVANLEEQVRQLNGRQEETTNRLQRLAEDLTKQVGDLSFRLQALEGGARPGAGARPGPPPLALSPPPAAGQGGGQGARRTPELAMQEGQAALARRDYQAAEAAAREVLAGSRASPRATDAQFLLAHALAGRREYQAAAIAYDDTYNRARTGPHAQDALLGLANALTAINERRPACDTLNKLRVEFLTPRPEVRDAASALRQRLGCR